jgi:outer membrane receptor for ferrienterochelin and colicins
MEKVMNLKFPGKRAADYLFIFLLFQLSMLFIPGLQKPSYGGPQSIKEDLAFLAEEGQIVESAAKYPQLIKNAPASVTVITHDEIKRYGWRTLVDFLKSIQGFYVTDDKNYNYLGVRGFQRAGDYNGRILALLNGHTLNEDVYQQFFMGNDSGIDMDIIDRVEIVRGPGSALYGTNAIFSVINIITKEGKDINGLRASLEAGSGNSNKGILTYGKTLSNGWDILINASYFKSIGQYIQFTEDIGVPVNHGGITNNDGEYAYNLFYRARYQDLTIQLAGNDREKQIPTAEYYAIFNDPREETFDGRYLAEVKYDHSFSEKYGFMIRVYDDWYRYRGYYPIMVDPVLLITKINTDYSVGQYYGGEVQIRREFENWNKLVVGSEYQKHNVLLQNYDINSYPPVLDNAVTFDLFSLYFEDEIKPFDHLILTLGARRDQYIGYSDSFSDKTTPRLGLVYNPISGTTFKILYGQAFRAPSSYELFYFDNVNITAGHAKPETITTLEGVLEQTLGSHLSSSLSVFQYVADDLIEIATDSVTGLLQYQNISRVRGEGAEAEIKGRWERGMEAYANVAYQTTRNEVTDSELSNSPHVVAKAGLILPLTADQAHVSFEEQYVGARNTYPQNWQVDPYMVTNLTLTASNLLDKFEFQASVFNLFDNRYFDPASVLPAPIQQVPQKGRSFFLKSSYTF